MAFDRRTKVILAVLGIVLGALSPAAIVAAEDFLAGYGNVDGGVQGGTDGPYIDLGGQYQLRSGNLATDDSYNLSTQNSGWVNYSAQCGARARADQITGAWSNVSELDVACGPLTINPRDLNESSVGGQATSYKFTSMTAGDGQMDFAYAASGQTNITVRADANSGTRYGAMNMDTGTGLDVGIADSNGQITFDDLPDGNYNVRIQRLGTLFVYNESSPTQLVDNTSVEIQFYYENGTTSEVYIRNTSDGRLDMTGLPADQPFVVVANADGYINRRIYVPSLLDSQRIYLIPESANVVEPMFDLTDFSGDFRPENTVLRIERVLNGSWRTVEGDFFGATGEFSAHLAFNERHRITLINTESGDTRDLGAYTPVTSGSKEIRVFADGTVNVTGIGTQAMINPAVRRLAGLEDTAISITFTPGSSTFQSYSAEGIYVPPSGSNVTVFTVSGSSDDGETFEQLANLSDRSGGRLVVTASWTTDGGVSGTNNATYIVTDPFDSQYSILAVIGDILDRLPDTNVPLFTNFVALLLTALVTGLAAWRTPFGPEVVGAIPVLMVAAFTVIQWMPRETLFLAAVAYVGVVALRRRV